MNRSFKDQHVVSSSPPSEPIIISADDDGLNELFRFDSNAMNIANCTGHQIHLSFSKSTGELIIREVLSDATVKRQRAVSGHLTLIGGAYDVKVCKESLAKGGLEAFFIRLALRDGCKLKRKSLEFDTANWNHTARELLCLYQHRSAVGRIKVLKIWIVKPFSNPSFDANIIRGALERGGALWMKSTEAPVLTEEPTEAPILAEKLTNPPVPTGYKDPDAVSSADCVSVLDYGEPPELSFSMKGRQPQWVNVGHKLEHSSTPEASTLRNKDTVSTTHSGQESWKDSRISELEGQLRLQTTAKETAESVNASLTRAKKLQDWALKDVRTTNIQLKQLIQSRDLMLAIYNEEYIHHAQRDISALATALAKAKGIAQGDREGIKAGFPSVYVGQPTVDRLLKNPFFVSNFLGSQQDTTQQKRKAHDYDEFDEASDDERSTGENNKRLKMH